MYKMNNMNGGALLSEGGYGCVYYPSLNCKLEESQKPTKNIALSTNECMREKGV